VKFLWYITVYKRGRGPHKTAWWAAAWRPMLCTARVVLTSYLSGFIPASCWKIREL